MSFTRYIFSKAGLRQWLRIVLVYAVVAGGLWFYLRWYTDHGEYVSVPDVRNMPLDKAMEALEQRNLHYAVVDSIYREEARGGSVWEQNPTPESQVKEGRQVFLSVYCLTPPMEAVRIEQGEYAPVALVKLKNKGMKTEVRYEPNNNLVGSVIKITWKGKILKPGDNIPRGEKLVVYVGESLGEKVLLPLLTGLSLDSVEAVLERHHLMLGNIIADTPLLSASDSAEARVCRQEPPYDPEMKVSPGRLIDVYVSKSPCQ